MKYHKGFGLGDLRTQSLNEIVYSEERKKYIQDFDVHDCKSCWLRDKNQFIEYLLAENPQHINYV
jgi:hypothetical protein